MKKNKIIYLILVCFLFFLFPLSCAKKEEPTPTKPPIERDPKTDQITYVGHEKCFTCHEQAKDSLANNPHLSAFKSLESFNITIDENIKIYPETATNGVDLKDAKIAGVMSNSYVIGSINDKYYRLATVKKTDSIWELKPADAKDINNDGTEDWIAKDYKCGICHSPGLTVTPEQKAEGLTPGFSCEVCHGPGSVHISTKSKDAIKNGKESCFNCHSSSEPKVEGDILIAQNHYGTRDWFDSNHNQGKAEDCLTCHTGHSVNAEGKLINKESSQALCSSCHGDKVKVDEIMWINPTDERKHFTKDHSFGKYPYEKLGDKPDTLPTEITNPEVIEAMKKKINK